MELSSNLHFLKAAGFFSPEFMSELSGFCAHHNVSHGQLFFKPLYSSYIISFLAAPQSHCCTEVSAVSFALEDSELDLAVCVFFDFRASSLAEGGRTMHIAA